MKDGFTFDDDAFVDAVPSWGGTVKTVPSSTDIETALSDDTLATAVYASSTGAFFDLVFVDNAAFNGVGTDIVIFEWYGPTPMAVEIAGVTLTFTGSRIGSVDGILHNVVQVELTDFGLADGEVVSALRISRPPDTTAAPTVSGVGALNSTAPPASGLDVGVDIRPWSDTNPVDPMSQGAIPVAILGSTTFDVADVDVPTLAFGPAGATPVHAAGYPQDVNDDGITDLLSLYWIPETGIAFGDEVACVTGETLGGVPLEGCDLVTTISFCGLGVELVFLLPPLMWLHRRRRGRGTAAA